MCSVVVFAAPCDSGCIGGDACGTCGECGSVFAVGDDGRTGNCLCRLGCALLALALAASGDPGWCMGDAGGVRDDTSCNADANPGISPLSKIIVDILGLDFSFGLGFADGSPNAMEGKLSYRRGPLNGGRLPDVCGLLLNVENVGDFPNGGGDSDVGVVPPDVGDLPNVDDPDDPPNVDDHPCDHPSNGGDPGAGVVPDVRGLLNMGDLPNGNDPDVDDVDDPGDLPDVDDVDDPGDDHPPNEDDLDVGVVPDVGGLADLSVLSDESESEPLGSGLSRSPSSSILSFGGLFDTIRVFLWGGDTSVRSLCPLEERSVDEDATERSVDTDAERSRASDSPETLVFLPIYSQNPQSMSKKRSRGKKKTIPVYWVRCPANHAM